MCDNSPTCTGFDSDNNMLPTRVFYQASNTYLTRLLSLASALSLTPTYNHPACPVILSLEDARSNAGFSTYSCSSSVSIVLPHYLYSHQLSPNWMSLLLTLLASVVGPRLHLSESVLFPQQMILLQSFSNLTPHLSLCRYQPRVATHTSWMARAFQQNSSKAVSY